jgi:hypothetical protein
LKTLTVDASDEAILDLVREWVSFIAEGDFESAYQLSAHDQYYGWTPDLMRTVIQNYGSVEPMPSGQKFVVTHIKDTTGGSKPRHEVNRLDRTLEVQSANSAVVANVWFDLPLNGEWSDLTATFEVQQMDDQLKLVLNDVHVF